MAPWIQLLKELEKRGVQNSVLCREGGTLSQELAKSGIDVFTYTPPAQWLPVFTSGIGKIVDRAKPDLIHTRLSSAAYLGGYWGRKKNIPVISTFDKYPKAKYYENSDVLIGCSSAVTAHIKKLKLPRARLIATILNPVLSKYYTRDWSARQKCRQSLGVKPGECVVLGMGRLVGWKAWDDFLRAIALIPERGGYHFWLVGSGNEEKKLKNLSAKLGIQNRIRFFPFAADVRPWLWAADLFVQSSKEPEGFSLMLIEAMAAGAVPIATNIGGTLDIVKDGVNGLLFSPSDIRTLSAAILRANHEEARASMALNAQRSAADINVGRISEETVDIYNKTLQLKR
ncbi:glycosyltransferase family 4 protein [Pyramidobacter sp.]|nr:glycosyltransferase family 4 protein [Pyramidobacter sp. CG50-2]